MRPCVIDIDPEPKKGKLKVDQVYSVGQLTVQRGEIPTLGPFVLPADATHFKLDIDKTFHLRPLVRVDCLVQVSFDGAATWTDRASESDIGGDSGVDDNGQPVTSFGSEYDIAPQRGQTPRQVRVQIHAVNGAFQSAGGVVMARKLAGLAKV